MERGNEMRATKKRDNRVVVCEIKGCTRPFVFSSPEQLVQAFVIDPNGNEVGKQYAFACSVCMAKYQDFFEGDQWQED